MSDYWDENPCVWRYWLEDEAAQLYRTSLEADEVYSLGDHAWVPVDFYGVISNTCNDINRITREEAGAIIARREEEAAARSRLQRPEELPRWGEPQWKRFFGDG